MLCSRYMIRLTNGLFNQTLIKISLQYVKFHCIHRSQLNCCTRCKIIKQNKAVGIVIHEEAPRRAKKERKKIGSFARNAYISVRINLSLKWCLLFQCTSRWHRQRARVTDTQINFKLSQEEELFRVCLSRTMFNLHIVIDDN